MGESRIVFSYSDHAMSPGAELDMCGHDGERLVVGTVLRCRYSEQAAQFVVTSRISDPDVIAAMAPCILFPSPRSRLCSV